MNYTEEIEIRQKEIDDLRKKQEEYKQENFFKLKGKYFKDEYSYIHVLEVLKRDKVTGYMMADSLYSEDAAKTNVNKVKNDGYFKDILEYVDPKHWQEITKEEFLEAFDKLRPE